MAIITVGDILDRGRHFELRLEKHYAEICDQTDNSGVRLVAGYLARCRLRQEKALAEFVPTQLGHMRKVELKFDIPFYPVRDLDAAPLSGDDLLESAIRHNAELIELYRSVLQQPLNDEVRGLFEALARIEERDLVMLKKMLAMHYF